MSGNLDFSRVLILDGATGSNLSLRGMPSGVCPEAWIADHPDLLMQLQREYAAAGSMAVFAPTFGANRHKLSKYGFGERTSELNKRLVAISREAVGPDVLVGGDLSPLGVFPVPVGNATFEEVFDIYHEQAAALAATDIDFFIIETMMTLFEARAALLACRSVSDLPIFVTLTLDESGRTPDGTSPEAALHILASLGASAFGVNCSTGPEEMVPIVTRLASLGILPIICKPNAGLPVTENGQSYYKMLPRDFAPAMASLPGAGVGILGGCCGTTPDHIVALSREVRDQSVPGKWASPPPFPADARHIFTDALPEEPEFIEISEDLPDDIADAEEYIALKISSEEDCELLEENTYLLSLPLILEGKAELLEKALRCYTGCACISIADKAEGEKLREQYGCILL